MIDHGSNVISKNVSSLAMLRVALFSLVLCGCTRTHASCPPSDAEPVTPDALGGSVHVEPQENPWGATVRFLGHEGTGVRGETVMAWRIDDDGYPPGLNVAPVIGVSLSASTDVVRFDVERSGGTLEARVLVAQGLRLGGGPVDVGLRLGDFPGAGLRWWDVSTRSVEPGIAADAELYDGSLEVRLVAAPPVESLGQFWAMDSGTSYGLRYDVHNHGIAERTVRIEVWGPDGDVHAEGGLARTALLPPGSFERVVATFRRDTPGPCATCFGVRVGDPDGWPVVDSVYHHVVIRPE